MNLVKKPVGFSRLNNLIRTISKLTSLLLIAASLTALFTTPAHASITLDASAATFNFDFSGTAGVKGGATDFTAKYTLISGSGKENGSIVRYNTVATVSGIAIDAAITTTLQGSATVSKYETSAGAGGPGSYFQVDQSGNGSLYFNFAFYEHGTYTGAGTGNPVILENIKVFSIDIDNGDQYTSFTGFQNYFLTSPTNLNVTQPSAGLVRFAAKPTAGSGTNRPQDQVQVQYLSLSSINIQVGATGPAFFGIGFGAATWAGVATPTATPNPYNAAPTSSDTSLNITASTPTTITKSNFGNYQDADGNPFTRVKITQLPSSGILEYLSSGLWTTVTLNQPITTADIDVNKLRLTAPASGTFKFMVYDSAAYSVASYTLTYTATSQSQTITFNNPGTKTLATATIASGATSTSSLTVTLVSDTVGICTISGLNILLVAEGECRVRANQSGNGTYSAATEVSQTFYVSSNAAQTITFADPGTVILNTNPKTISSSSTATSGLTVTLTSYSLLVCTISGLNIVLVGTGSCQVRATQAGGLSSGITYAQASPVERIFTVSPVSYTITYANGGGTGTLPTESAKIATGTFSVAAGTGLTKSGYTFDHWNDGSTNYNAASTYTVGSANITLTAVWVANTYTVTYNNNSGSGTHANDSYITAGAALTLADGTGFSKSGYSFGGWSTTQNDASTVITSYSSYASITVYAIWTAVSYSVTYDLNLGSGTAPTQVNRTVGQTFSVAASTGLSKGTDTFSAWNTQANGLGLDYHPTDLFTMPAAAVTLYAKWVSAASKTITFNSNNGAGLVATQSAASATNSRANTFTKSGYTFIGWNLNQNALIATYADEFNYDFTADLNLFAIWTANPYTVTYNNNNGAGTHATGTFTAGGTALTLPDGTGFSKTGYTFGGWSTTQDDASTVITTYSSFADKIVYAIWTGNGYTVTFDATTNGGTAMSPLTGVFTVGGTGITLPIPASRTGYTFAGFFTGASSGTEVTTPYSPSGSVTIYARWTADVYTITYDATTNGGTAISPLTAAYTVGNTGLTLPTPAARTGYMFDGWYLAATGGDSLASPYVATSTRTLYAQWVPEAYVITHDATTNGGAVMSPLTSYYSPGSVAFALPEPSARSGFTFIGWFAAATGGSALADPYTPAGTETIYARWTADTYVVTYDATTNGGTAISPLTASFTGGGSGITLPSPAARNGYTFSGWFTASTGGSQLSSPYTPSATTTIYAQWANAVVNKTVTFIANGGVGSTPSQSASSSTNLNGNGFARSGFVFAYWSTNENGSGTIFANGSTYSFANDMTLYAQWNQITYNYWITYNSNGGSGSMSQQSGSGISVKLDQNRFSRAGYTFAGWGTSTTGPNSYFDGQSFGIGGPLTVTLYAQWNLITYAFNVSYNGNGGSGSAPSQSGTALNLNIKTNSFSRSGFTFTTWNTSANGTGTNYATGQLVSFNSPLTLNLYAQWVPNSYPFSVTYLANGGNGSMGNLTGSAPTMTISENGFSRPGYAFSGWATYAGGSGTRYLPGQVIPLTASKTLIVYAQWTLITYTYSVTYNANFGSNSPISQSGVGVNFKVKSNSYSRSGYNFLSWNTNSNGTGTRYDALETVTLTSATNISLYAQWEEKDKNKSAVVPLSNQSPNPNNQVNAGTTVVSVVGGTATPSPSASPSVTPSPSASPSVTPSPSASPSVTPSPSASPSVTPSPSPSDSPSDSPEPAPLLTMKVTYKGLGITNVSLIGEEVVVETAPTFSGKTSAIVVLTQGKQITKITIPVTVTPDPVSNAKFTPVSDSSTQVTWAASKNATAYSVYLNDRLTCSGKDLSCEIGSLLGPNAVITVKARGGGSTISDPVLAAYAAGEHINVAMVNFDTGKYNLTASAIRVLKSTAKLIKEQGFQHIYVSGHVDIRPGLDDQILSDNRAQSTRDYLQSLLPGIEIQIRGFGSTEPLALGMDSESLAENRRAQISIW